MRNQALIVLPAARRCIGLALACAWLTLANPARAASMLRCEGDDDSVSYVSAGNGNAHCSRLSMLWQWRPPASASGAQTGGTTPESRRAVAVQPAAIGPLDGANTALPLGAPRRAAPA
ncbi:hypothetical protein AWB75_04231 [Caballeronia catudaia]|uniref:Lipoprotein n=1 Tax=Caballeronia catudaia TaxID=1777136 RepID=A0A158BYU4_9BURK|nr:hypothetical protein [Caballeronia catudaia]SAK75278.1 hypothetical protein AWB75_04231 [Caballeronia catudaia]